MIDTTKFYCCISEEVKNIIKSKLDLTSKINADTGEIYYIYSSGGIKGSYSTNMNINTEDTGIKYNLGPSPILVVEGSFHKWSKGYNSHNGYTNLSYILNKIIVNIEKDFNVRLPRFYKWYIQRVDISICYNLENQDNVKSYINNLSYMTYPRRKTRFYCNESLYFSGSSTTLKIYNKYTEFLKHDVNRLAKSHFDFGNMFEELQGFLRFECEIKKKKLVDIYGDTNILAVKLKYKDLYEIWKSEFMKLYKINENGLKIVKDNNDVKNRLYDKYSNSKASNLYGFYLSIIHEGYKNVFLENSKSTFYRKISDLKNAGIDFSQNAFVLENIDYNEKFIDFNPFQENSKFREVV